MSDMEWYGDEKDPAVVFSSVAAVAVYRNAGDLVLKQQGANGLDDDVIIIPEMFVPMVLAAINKAMLEK
jgi:hypothetical protein